MSEDDDPVEKLKDEVSHLKEKLGRLEKENNSSAIEQKLRQYKSVGVAVTLSIVLGFVGILGIGHFYVGENRKGFAFLISGIFLDFLIVVAISMTLDGTDMEEFTVVSTMLLIFIIPYLALYIWQILDSRKLCKKHNRRLDQMGKRTW